MSVGNPKQFADDSYTVKKGGEFGSTAYPNGRQPSSGPGTQRQPLADERQMAEGGRTLPPPRLGVYQQLVRQEANGCH